MPLLCVFFGLAWLAGAYVLAAGGVEPVATFFFLFAWAGLVYTCDRLIAVAEGRSLIGRLGGRGFALLVLWSAVNWFLYELANLRLANWHYVFVTDSDGLRFAGTVLAFGTVLPGVFWIDHWLGARGALASRPWRRLRVTPGRLAALQAAGALCLALCLAAPRVFFPLIWLVTAMLLAPVNYRNGCDGWLRQWARGEYGPTLRMLLAGAIAGGCWELFNFRARAKWIYTVPFFDELKLFEMPVLGFLGFPPFALECACLYRLLVWYRLAPPFGAFAQAGPGRGAWLSAAAGAAGLAIVAAGYAGVDRVIITSRTPRVADVAVLSQGERQALSAAGIAHLTQLSGWGSAGRWERVRSALGDSATARLRELARLYLHQGIGTTFGNRLVAAGYRSLDGLRGAGVDEVWARLAAAAAPGRAPTPAQVKVWLRRLP